jgi:hypothetical protein
MAAMEGILEWLVLAESTPSTEDRHPPYELKYSRYARKPSLWVVRSRFRTLP